MYYVIAITHHLFFFSLVHKKLITCWCMHGSFYVDDFYVTYEDGDPPLVDPSHSHHTISLYNLFF